jgi:branched-chain amino acid transport system ATP-binding protein
MQLLEAVKVSKNFGGLAAISSVDFYLNQGEILGLIGPNGAGKTTLFNLISGAFKPKAGVIRFKDKPINGMQPNKICRLGIARTFQLVKVFSHLTVFENVLMGALFGLPKSLSQQEASVLAKEMIDFVELSEYKSLPAGELTLVNQKRLEVARAMATKPEILLLDELMAGLNPTEVEHAIGMVRRIRDRGITIIMIEHVMHAIMNVCDRIIVLHHGVKIAEGTPKEIANNQQVIDIYLGAV